MTSTLQVSQESQPQLKRYRRRWNEDSPRSINVVDDVLGVSSDRDWLPSKKDGDGCSLLNSTRDEQFRRKKERARRHENDQNANRRDRGGNRDKRYDQDRNRCSPDRRRRSEDRRSPDRRPGNSTPQDRSPKDRTPPPDQSPLNRGYQDNGRRKANGRRPDTQMQREDSEAAGRVKKMRYLQTMAYMVYGVCIVLDLIALVMQWATCGSPPSPLCKAPFRGGHWMIIIGLLITLSVIVGIASIVFLTKGIAAHDEGKKKHVSAIDGTAALGVVLRLVAIMAFLMAAFRFDENGVDEMTVGFFCVCVAIGLHVLASTLALCSFTYSGAWTIFSNRLIQMPRPIQVEIETPYRKNPILVDISVEPSYSVE